MKTYAEIRVTLLLLLLTPPLILAQGAGNELPTPELQELSKSMLCGETQISLTCSGSLEPFGLPCDSTELAFKPIHPNGSTRIVRVRQAANSGAHADKFPRLASCRTGANNQNYVVVYFSNGPLDCGQCIVNELYTAQGKRLTHLSKNLDKEINRLGIRYGDPKEKSIELVKPN